MQALLKGCIEQGFKRIRVHVLTDGRDVPDGSSYQFVEMLEKDLEELHKQYGVDVQIASGGGRMAVTMDRYEVGSHDHAEFALDLHHHRYKHVQKLLCNNTWDYVWLL